MNALKKGMLLITSQKIYFSSTALRPINLSWDNSGQFNDKCLPSSIPNQNIIEPMLSDLKEQKIYMNFQDLQGHLALILVHKVKNLYESIPRRIQAILKKQWIKYTLLSKWTVHCREKTF